MSRLIKLLMERDELTLQAAIAQVEEAKKELARRLEQADGDDPYAICKDFFGLGPDFIENLLH